MSADFQSALMTAGILPAKTSAIILITNFHIDGHCWLKNPDIAGAVKNALRYFDGKMMALAKRFLSNDKDDSEF